MNKKANSELTRSRHIFNGHNVRPHSEVSEVSGSESIRTRVFQQLDKNPLLTAMPLCRILEYDYKRSGHYIENLRSAWKAHYRNGLGSKCPKFHHWRGFAYAPVDVDRAAPLECGWALSGARNRGLIFRDKLGRLEWFETGRINIWVRKPANPGRLSQLLSNAFFRTKLITDLRVLEVFIGSVEFGGAHAVYETGERLPYRKIEDFQESNGVIIKTGDLSDPTAIEIEFHRPKWAEEIQGTTEALIDTIRRLNDPGKPGSEKSIGVV